MESSELFLASLELDGRRPETIRTHKRLYSRFEQWCFEKRLEPLPASIETVALYLCHIAPRYKAGSLSNALSAISYVHRMNGHRFDRNPLKPIIRSIGRVHGAATRKKPPIDLDYLRALLEHFPDHRRGLRDRAILMIGFCGGLRCQEITHLHYAEFGDGAIGRLRIDRDGATIEMRYSGNAVTRARTFVKYIPRHSEFCAVEALEDWICEANITSGPLFRAIDKHGHISGRRLKRNSASVILRHAVMVGEVARGRTPTQAAEIARPFTIQSLRIGFIKSALEAGATPERIAMHLGWTTSYCIEYYQLRYKTVRHNPLQAVMGIDQPSGDPDTARQASPDPAPSSYEPNVGISSDEFRRRYGSEPDCNQALVRLRWDGGFQCPRCRQSRYNYFRTRRMYRCTGCKFQTTVRAGTIFQNSPLPLTKWFYAYYLVRSRPHVTPRELSRELGVKWESAQRMKQMLSHAMVEGAEGMDLDRLVQAETDQESSKRPTIG